MPKNSKRTKKQPKRSTSTARPNQSNNNNNKKNNQVQTNNNNNLSIIPSSSSSIESLDDSLTEPLGVYQDFLSIARALGISPSHVDQETLSLLIEPENKSTEEQGDSKSISCSSSTSSQSIQSALEEKMSKLQQQWLLENQQELSLFGAAQKEEKQLKQQLDEASTITHKLRVLHHRCLKLLSENEKHAREVMYLQQRQEEEALQKGEWCADLSRAASHQSHLEALCLDLQTYGPFLNSSSSLNSSSLNSSSSSSLNPSSSSLNSSRGKKNENLTKKSKGNQQQEKQQEKSTSDLSNDSTSITTLIPSSSSSSIELTDPLVNRALQLARFPPFSSTDIVETDERHSALLALRQVLTADLDASLIPLFEEQLMNNNDNNNNNSEISFDLNSLTPEMKIEAWKTRSNHLLEMYRLRERHFAAMLHRRDLEQRLLESKLKHQFNVATQEALKAQAYKEQITTLGKTERALRHQLSMYAEKFEQFQVTLSKSNDVFTTFKLEMQKMTKTIQKLEKENASLRKKTEKSDSDLSSLMEDRTKLQKDLNTSYQRTVKLEQICRALQNERKLGSQQPHPAVSESQPSSTTQESNQTQ